MTNVNNECSDLIRTMAPQRLFANTNPVMQIGAYNESLPFIGGTGDTIQSPLGVGTNRWQKIPQPFMHPPPPSDLKVIKDSIQELYKPDIRQIGRLEFYKSYLKTIDRENSYPRGYKVLEFSLFSGEDGQSTSEHVARFTVQYGELTNNENFSYFKLRLFPNSLTRVAFTWYVTLARNSIKSWQEIERQFHTQFFKIEPKICIAELSRVTQRGGEPVDSFITHFKRMRNKCKIHLPETKYMKMAQRELDIELRKKFQGMEFRDFYELVAKVIECEELLREENQRRKTSMGTYCREMNSKEMVVADLLCTCSFIALYL